MSEQVVIGVGNPYRRDDAAGIEVALTLRSRAPAAVEVFEHDGEPVGLLQAWEGAGTAWVVDAVRDVGEPGSVHRVDVTAEGVPGRPRRDSSHALGIGEAVDLAGALDRLPRRLILFGISGSDFRAGVGLTPEVARAVSRVVETVLAEIRGGDAECA